MWTFALVIPLFLACGGDAEKPKGTQGSGGEKAVMLTPAPKASAGPPVAYETIRVEPGTFTMGSALDDADRDGDEGPVEVTLSKPFLLGKGEVTQALWEQVMGANPSRVKDAALPVDQVSWFDAVVFANALSARDGHAPAYTVQGQNVTANTGADGWRLPTEAEWEFAARAGAAAPFAGGTEADAVAWHKGNAEGASHPPCQKSPNALGFCDMSGNVLEWVWDRYAPYAAGPQTDPRGADTNDGARVARGGAYSSPSLHGRVANRIRSLPTLRFVTNGLRLARNG